jgi:transaldolase
MDTVVGIKKFNYLQKAINSTPTKFWVNNPTMDEASKALQMGALGVTTNPTFCAKIMKSGEYNDVASIIDSVVPEVKDDRVAADFVFQKCTKRILEIYEPLFEKSGKKYGYVTIQDDPLREHDAKLIIDAALRHSKLGKNFMAKIPVTKAGIEAIEFLVAKNIPICATEIFSVAQAVEVCELYERITNKTGNRPAFFTTHITGIYDQYISELLKNKKLDADLAIVSKAGCIVGRKIYHLLKQRGYHTTLLGGGVREPLHFTGFVGGDMHITMNYNTIVELGELKEQVVSQIDGVTSPSDVSLLRGAIPDFKRAYDDDGLSTEEYSGYGPVVLFRSMFVEGYNKLVDEVKKRRYKTITY